MNTYSYKAARMTRIIRSTRVAFTEGNRTKFGTVIDVMHDHYKIECDDGCTRRILKERVEAVTPPTNAHTG
jgi:hypothetical protein